MLDESDGKVDFCVFRVLNAKIEQFEGERVAGDEVWRSEDDVRPQRCGIQHHTTPSFAYSSHGQVVFDMVHVWRPVIRCNRALQDLRLSMPEDIGNDLWQEAIEGSRCIWLVHHFTNGVTMCFGHLIVSRDCIVEKQRRRVRNIGCSFGVG